jgi:hypothetical protein
MTNAAVAFVNSADTGIITGSSEAALAPFLNLKNKHVRRRWVGTITGTEHIIVDLGASIAWDTLALLGTNLDATATTRVRGSNSDPTGAAGEIYDSGSSAGRIDASYGALIILRPSSTASRYVRIDLSQTATVIKAGRLFIGMRTLVAVNFSAGWSRSWIDSSRRTEGVSGLVFDDVLDTYKVIDVSFDALSEAERNGFVETIDRSIGTHGDFLFIENPDSSNLGRDSVWGFLDTQSPVVEPFIASSRVFSKTYRIRQRL